MALFTVFGNPVAHSLSPQIHSAFAAQHGLPVRYTPSLTSQAQFRRAVSTFFFNGGAGANVTVPFKQQAFQLVTHVTERAAQAEAVNTLIPLGFGQILGDNTDGIGLVTDLKDNLSQQLSQRTIVLLGAGGAARGALFALLNQPVERIIIANRSVERAQLLAQQCRDQRVTGCGFAELEIPQGSLLINATSASLGQQKLAIAADQLGHASCAYDMMYGAQPTVFMRQVTVAGVRGVYDGLGMLVEQAAVAFKLWHDVAELDTKAVIAHLREQLR